MLPKGGFDTALTASELTWDNFGAGYLAGLGAGYTELGPGRPAGHARKVPRICT